MNVQVQVVFPFANRVPAVLVTAPTYAEPQVPTQSPAGESPVTAQTPASPVAVHRLQLEKLLTSMNGKFVGVDFLKTDGSQRKLNGRLGVRCHLKGGVNNVEAADRPYIVIYDVKSKGYRALNLATVSEVRARHTKYAVIG